MSREVRSQQASRRVFLRRYYHGDMREMRNGTYRVVVSEAFDACRARLPWWQIYPLSGGLVKTRYVPFRLDDDGAAAASA